MKRWQITLAAVVIVAGIGYAMEGNPDADTWATLFWLSLLANVALGMMLADAKGWAKW